jgi:hypothetical protein
MSRHVVAWQRLDTTGVEYAEIDLGPLRLEGRVVLVEDGAAAAISYDVACDDAGWRLRLEVGQQAEARAAWVTFPSLEVRPLRHAYRRTGPSTYEYEAPEHAFRAEVTVDERDVVVRYGSLWARVTR